MTTFSEKARTFMFTIPASIIWYAIAGIILYSAQMQFDFRNMSTYFWILALIVPVFFIVSALVVSDGDNEEAFYYASLFTIIASAVVAVILAIVSTFGTNLYHAQKNYTEVASYVEVQKDGELAFPELIKDGDTSKLPLFGEQEARKKAEAELASSPLCSQTSVINSSFMSQNVNGDFVYIGESAPNSVFKRNADNMYYVINRNTGKTETFHPEFLYGNSRYFGENAARMMKNWYSGKGYITDVDLEIDNDGNPMYVGSIVCRNRLNGLRDVIGIVVLDPVNGKIKQYDINEIPEWVDRVYPEEVLTQRISIWGKYGKGFKNSLFKKEGVLIPTSDNAEGSTYEVVYMNGEAYIWTGMIPANASGTAVNGIIVASLKTGKITYYEQSGISENNACSVAQGLVQEKGYIASFPVPLKINGIEAMFMLMRDDAGNIAGYSLVAYDDYTKSAYATTVNEVIRNFVGVVGEENKVTASDEKPVELTGDIVAIATEVVDGRTVYYFAIDGKVFTCNSKINTAIVFAKVGDRVKIKYLPTKNGDTYILKNFEFVENTFEIAN